MSAPSKGGYKWVAEIAEGKHITNDTFGRLEALLRDPNAPASHRSQYRAMLNNLPRLKSAFDELDRIGVQSKDGRLVDLEEIKKAIITAQEVEQELSALANEGDHVPSGAVLLVARLWRALLLRIIEATGLAEELEA